ncbi:inositol monophosphatase family protein [Commensalibacter oyaizuii]|uniref:Inositol monophosphatase family protein n=1 Tax=Commensalibacter oyaizuii TaxID=3043873 RepID=A0ABT6PZI5_9PROT|nr:inositol monophosphatase family protein [Commensalibacter sp. TBRC 16381]MDI2090267.1 inositol monophosphatase family protein [Commensalibacter sp. TBRC 16381]
MTKLQLDSFLQIAQEAVQEAGKVIRPYFRQSITTDIKSDDSPVTQADRESEQVIRKILQRETPDFGIIGEEYGSSNKTQSKYQWVIDPIDGTRAFITGRPLFGVLIALLYEGRPVLGIIDQPMTKERWIGVEGQPSQFISELGGKIGTRACPELRFAEASCTAPEILNEAPNPKWVRVCDKVKRMTWGGDCYAYGLLALGQIDLIIEHGNQIWDWAALVPIIEGAGGSITDWQGNPLNLSSNETVLALGDISLKQQVIELLNDDI